MADTLQKHANLCSCALTGEQHKWAACGASSLTPALMGVDPMLQLVLLVGW